MSLKQDRFYKFAMITLDKNNHNKDCQVNTKAKLLTPKSIILPQSLNVATKLIKQPCPNK